METPAINFRVRLTLLCAVLMALLSIALLVPQFVMSRPQAIQRERLIDTQGSYADCPVEIVGVETRKGKIILSKSFLDDDDWMKGLTVRFKNKSDKPLSHVGVKLTFDRPADQSSQPRASWDLWYGVSPFYFKRDEPIPPAVIQLIHPGADGVLSLSEMEYGDLRSFLTEVNFPLSI